MLIEWEGLAREALTRAQIDAPVDPWQLAERLGFVVRDAAHGLPTCLSGSTILLETGQRPERRAFGVAHEIGHALLRASRIANTERGANSVGSALLLPRIDFLRDLRQVGWNLAALRERHPHASHEALGRRITMLRDAVLWVLDRDREGRRHRYRVLSPGLPDWMREPSRPELEAVQAAAADLVPVESVAGVCAWPLPEAGHLRVLCLSAADSLACTR